jgi:hypothetical protein
MRAYNQTTQFETALMLVAFGLMGLVISMLLVSYGLDIPTDCSF